MTVSSVVFKKKFNFIAIIDFFVIVVMIEFFSALFTIEKSIVKRGG